MNMAALQVPRGQAIFSKEDCSPFDIGVVFNDVSSFTDAQKLEFIEKIWKPEQGFAFPKTLENHKNRKFRSVWLREYPWLAYSKYLDAALCLPCVLFTVGKPKVDKLVKSPMTYWTSASTKITNHCRGKCESHNCAVIRMDNFVKTMRNEAVPVDQQLNTIMQEQIAKNRQILASLFKSIIFCGQSNIALRGHRDDNPRDKPNQSNFHQLLAFRVDSGDAILQEHLLNAPRNATYTSKTIQNEMISTVGRYILDNLSGEMRDSKYFAILADEAADISNKQNLSMVIRFVDASSTIREEFVGFYQCKEGTTGAALKDIILKVVADLGLSMDDCRGQCYDGAGGMAGEYSGVAARIQGQFEKAMYIHCLSHVLNLCVADTCKISLVRNMMGTVRKLSEFFHNSPKRQGYLEKKILDLQPNTTRTTLLDVCKTRWLARIEGFDRCVEFLHPVISTLEDISVNRDAFGNQVWNHNSRIDAQALVNSITFPFLVTLVVVGYVLNLTKPLTTQLQKVQMDLMEAKSEIEEVKTVLRLVRADIDRKHHALYDIVMDKARQILVAESMPRINQRQIHRANAPATTPEEYYRINLTSVFLDHAIAQIDTRFQPEQVTTYSKGTSLTPKKLKNDPNWKANVKEFCQEYRRDIPNPVGLDAELFMWENKWRHFFNIHGTDDNECPANIKELLQCTDKEAYPNVYTILQILATIPVTSCTCERSISALRILKTYLRNTMTEDRLNGLALMYAHRGIVLPDIDKLIDMFANLHPRRMKMVNILEDEEL